MATNSPYVQALKRQYQRICASVSQRNGQDAEFHASLWKHKDITNPPALTEAQLDGLFTPNSAFERYAEILCICWTCFQQGNLKQAWKHAFQVSKLTIKILDGFTQENWYLPLIYVGLELTQSVAFKHDEKRRDNDAVNTTMTDLLTLTRTIRRNQGKADADNQSQKLAALFVINQLLKLSFKTEQLSYCKTAMITADGYVSDLQLFPQSHVVQFKFYRGRYNMFEENYPEAKADLEYALNICHKGATKCKIKILELLIPINLLFGVFPKKELLQQYPIPHLIGIINACRSGNIKQFHAESEKHQQTFIESGIFLLITMVEPLCYRKIIQKLFAVQTKRFNQKEITVRPHILPIAEIQLALTVQGGMIKNTELECILANLIFKNIIKGYVAHGKALVLSREEAFPKLADMKRNI